MPISMEEVAILIHESALDEMIEREARIIRKMRSLQQELDELGNDIRAKKFSISAARDAWLRSCVRG